MMKYKLLCLVLDNETKEEMCFDAETYAESKKELLECDIATINTNLNCNYYTFIKILDVRCSEEQEEIIRVLSSYNDALQTQDVEKYIDMNQFAELSTLMFSSKNISVTYDSSNKKLIIETF